MRLGKVIGHVTLSDHLAVYRGARWLVISPLDKGQMAQSVPPGVSAIPSLIVYDNVGAGVGDIIGFVEGGEATQAFDFPMPIDAFNVCIIDRIHYQPPMAAAS